MGNYNTEGRTVYPECLNNSCVIFSSFNIFHFVSFISELYNTYLRILSPHRPYQELNTWIIWQRICAANLTSKILRNIWYCRYFVQDEIYWSHERLYWVILEEALLQQPQRYEVAIGIILPWYCHNIAIIFPWYCNKKKVILHWFSKIVFWVSRSILILIDAEASVRPSSVRFAEASVGAQPVFKEL